MLFRQYIIQGRIGLESRKGDKMKITKQQMINHCACKYIETNDPKWERMLERVHEFWIDNTLYTLSSYPE